MRLRLLVLVVALVVAGCATPAEDVGAAGTNGTAPDGGPLTSPPEDVVDDGTRTDLGHMPHLHDYWQGKERVTLFDGELEPDALNLTFATFFQVVFGQSAVVGGMQFYLPEGQIVYEGTGVVELTASWDDPRVTGIGFVYESPDAPEWKVGGSLPNGEPFPLEITPAQTDMPHAKSSKWWFAFGPDESPGVLAGPFRLKIDIVRVGDVMTFPAHPDFWQGAHELTLLDADHHGEVPSYAKRLAQPATQGEFTEDWLLLENVVPMETQALRVVATITSAESTPGEVSSFGLFYHGAESRAPLRCPVKDVESFPQTLEWVVPVSMDMTDSPYAEASMWRVLVEPHVVLADGTPQMGGMTDVSYDFHATVTALHMAPDEMDECTRDQN